MKGKTVAVLRGGPGAEYDISMQTGAGVIDALKNMQCTTKDIIISRSSKWLVEGYMKDPQDALIGVDVVFLALHGEYGEDGQIQRLLERFSIPYTGSTPYSSAIAMNKELAKNHLTKLELLFPKHMRITRSGVTDPMQTALSIGDLFGPKYIVKPTSGGSSLGTMIANNPHELGSVLKKLLPEYEDLMVEEYITGREATVGILEDFRNQKLYHLPTVEIIPPESAGFFAAEVKYSGETQEICPGRFKTSEKKALAQAAQAIHKQLNLRHYSRSDFIVSDEGIYFLEVNTLPGLTDNSLLPKALQAVGGEYKDLVRHLLLLAVNE